MDMGAHNQGRQSMKSGFPYSSSFEMAERSKGPSVAAGGRSGYNGGHMGHSPHHPPHYHKYHSTMHSQQLHSVVTSSFSVEDEREDMSMSRMAAHRPSALRTNFAESRSGPEDDHRPLDPSNDYDGRVAPPDIHPPGPSPMMIPPSPSGHSSRSGMARAPMGAPPPPPPPPSYDYYSPRDPLKRSFWHHAKPCDYYSMPVHPEFLPPKRPKIGCPSKAEVVLTPRVSVEEPVDMEHNHVYPAKYENWSNGRSMSWSAHDDAHEYNRMMQRNHSFPGQWNAPLQLPHATPSPPGRDCGWFDGSRPAHPHPSPNMPCQPSPHGPPMYSPANKQYSGPWYNEYNRPPVYPRPTPRPLSPPHINRGMAPSWSNGSPAHVMQNRDDGHTSRDTESNRGSMEPRHPATLENERQAADLETQTQPARQAETQQSLPPLISQGSTIITEEGTKIRLLALPEDRISLSETLCVVRENIEVFTATVNDVEAPAPGRKHAVVVGQVGLRCIHCRHTTKTSDRVKRAVCYPSSLKRIYRTIIDMKLDHFLHCKFVPMSLKERLTELKAINTRSTGTTMQYFIRAAKSLGMVDGSSGVRLVEQSLNVEKGNSEHSDAPLCDDRLSSSGKMPSANGDRAEDTNFPRRTDSTLSDDSVSGHFDGSSSSTDSHKVLLAAVSSFTGKIPLALAEDKMSLSPLRCFLREQVCAFSATEEDIAVRTPTTFSVSVGQVGIGCIHCLHQPAKLRSNRAVCFPFSISRIYQSVADIQRFHLGECKMLPAAVRETFVELQNASSKGSKGLATRQYWVTSAKKIGLVDTEKGIRFGRDPTVATTPAVSLDILAQVASNVTTASRPLVLPSDKPFIAEFLYVVMDQLQPCRFTEADRNKRRLKDVGCIGVECKHCAGQVESRKFFWSSVNAVESNFVSVHTHMMECKMIPQELKDHFAELKKLRKEQTSALKTGSQKAFFSRVWGRLHGDDEETLSNLYHDETQVAAESVEEVKSGLQNMSMVSV